MQIKSKQFISLILAVGLLISPAAAFAKSNYTYELQQSNTQNAVYYNKKQTSVKNIKTEENTQTGEVLKGSVEVQITPYCQDWSSTDAFNVINHIGAKLIVNNDIDKKMQFVVSDKDEANASTDIHNTISVYTGLLKYVETEDELAYVIGHEMGHVTKNHVKKSIIRRGIIVTAGVAGAVLSTLGTVGNSAKAATSGYVLAGTTAAGELVNKKLSRGQETKSDLASIDYMVNAGYNPLAAISMLNKISGNYFDFFSDHPSGEKRIKKAYKYIQENYPEYIEKGYDTSSYEKALSIINKK